MEQAALSKLNEVRAAFEYPERYFRVNRFNIRIRQQAVEELVRGLPCRRILDIGCGDGSISLPLLRSDTRLTLLDLSSRMISEARTNIPAVWATNVDTLNTDFMRAPLGEHSFDLVLCLGVLAHVDSPSATLGKIARVLRPGGHLVLEFTDAFHPLGRPTVVYHKILDVLRPPHYPLNLFSRAKMFRMLDQQQLQVDAAYRYSLFFPGLHRLLSQESLYRVVRTLFGTPGHNSRALLGNQYICLVSAEPNAARDCGGAPL